MKKIEAKIVVDSINPQGNRITTFLLTYPRFIHAELMTHRMFSRNSASSRAIPFEKMVKMVEEDPFIPIAWQKDHKGMQGTEYFTNEEDIIRERLDWLYDKKYAIKKAKDRNKRGVTKQLCNRPLEPFMWHTVLVTATEWENFFELRCPKYHTPVSGEGFYFRSKKDCIANHSSLENIKKLEGFTFYDWESINSSQAEIHIQALAESMWDARNESKPKLLQAGEWHIPFGDHIDLNKAFSAGKYIAEITSDFNWGQEQTILNSVKVATARCARLSYMTFDGEIDYEKDIQLHNRLLADCHMSPFEHCARAMSDKEYKTFIKGSGDYTTMHSGLVFANEDKGWCNNFKGFIPYRYIIEKKIHCQ